jgi:cytidyltransferase-like protein
MPKHVVITGGFDDLRSPDVRFLEESAKLGLLTVLLWSDVSIRKLTGADPKFPEAERAYLLESIRFVSRVELVDGPEDPGSLPEIPGFRPDCWVARAAQDTSARKSFCAARGMGCEVISDKSLEGFPEAPPAATPAGRKKVIVTGCYDWFHSGHVRFFQEVSAHGDLYVGIGSDANVRSLKGPSHPMHSQEERRYMVGAIRFVTQAMVATGRGWLDAEPEIDRLRPDIYAVNEDGDRGGKREFCERRGIEYLVLKRTPAPGLPPRSSTNLRGF